MLSLAWDWQACTQKPLELLSIRQSFRTLDTCSHFDHLQVPQYNPAGFSQAMAQQLQQQSIQLRMFWEQQHLEIQQVGTDPAEFKNHQLPLARIKKVGMACCFIFAEICCSQLTSLLGHMSADHEIR